MLEKPPEEVESVKIGLNDMLEKILIKMEKFLVLLNSLNFFAISLRAFELTLKFGDFSSNFI